MAIFLKILIGLIIFDLVIDIYKFIKGKYEYKNKMIFEIIIDIMSLIFILMLLG